MLKEIALNDYVLTTSIKLTFDQGMTALSGETGAGKSVILDAIGLLLGNRANTKSIRAGAPFSSITGLFDIDSNQFCQKWLKDHDIALNDDYCLIKRVVYSDAKSKAEINGVSVTLSMLREFTSSLIEIHGQNQQLAFTNKSYQRNFLDAFSNCQSEVDSYSRDYNNYKELKNKVIYNEKNLNKNQTHLDYLKYQYDEIDALQLSSGDWEKICKTHQIGVNQEARKKTINAIVSALGDENGIIANLHRLHSQIDKSNSLGDMRDKLLASLNTAVIELEELQATVRNESGDGEPSELSGLSIDELESKMAAVHNIARKHSVEPEELIEFKNELNTQIEDLNNDINNLVQSKEKLKALESDLRAKAQRISQKRIAGAEIVSQDTHGYLSQLALGSAQFEIVVKSNQENLTSNGIDTVEYRVSFNPGTELKSMEKTASGGELSRLALSLHLALADQKTNQNNATHSMFFDEIETGIGGTTINKLAELLHNLSKHHQILVITHHASIAAKASLHYSVNKTEHFEKTEVKIDNLSEQQRVAELTRMLGGMQASANTELIARDLLSKK